MAAYRKIVYETPGFTDYFFAATPIREIAELNIGSRPAIRPKEGASSRAIEDLRAIPWSFSWGQCRMALPGWCGFGSAIEAYLAAAGPDQRAARVELLQRMHRQWPFFRTLLSNLDMVLAKSDLRIAARYVELVEDKAVARRIFTALRAEWQRAHDALELITGEAERLQSNAALARSIAHRFPYLDPLNHLQVELLRRYRQRTRQARQGAWKAWSGCSAASTSASTASQPACAIPAERGRTVPPRTQPPALRRACPVAGQRRPHRRHLAPRHRQPLVQRRHAHGPAVGVGLGFVAAQLQFADGTPRHQRIAVDADEGVAQALLQFGERLVEHITVLGGTQGDVFLLGLQVQQFRIRQPQHAAAVVDHQRRALGQAARAPDAGAASPAAAQPAGVRAAPAW